MDAQERLRRAEDHIFSTGLSDSGARLALANMRYGLAKVHHVQEALGMRPDATFVAAPDLTVTRNVARWRSGFGYGGVVAWGDGEDELVILDLKPNACGMIVGALDHLPNRTELLQRVHDLGHTRVEIDGIPVTWDFGKSNHFIDVCRVIPMDGARLPPFVFLMHFAGDELRGDGPHGPGIYWDKSATLRRWMRVHETPFGCLRVLVGGHARAYVRHYQRVEAFVRERRRYAAAYVFGPHDVLNNETHQGLTGINRMVLGCYSFAPGAGEGLLYPVGLRPDLPSYLVRGRPNLSRAAMDRLGFDGRARRLGVSERVEGAHVLPHGGGYVFPDIAGVACVHELDGERYFELEPSSGQGRQIVEDVRDLPFEYRDEKVLDRAVELDMLEVVACLVPEFVLKI
ncbi:MAG TPA: hypothetical protein VFQ22_01415 [Longimicrobiales bacterium]|nr:hypothetical protein [Longimicrobiales bacterium]